MLPLEHSAILSSFIKLPFAIKTFVLSIFEWPLKTGFTAVLCQTYWSVLLAEGLPCGRVALFKDIAQCLYSASVKVFRINPEFRILKLTFHRNLVSKCWIREIIITSLDEFSDYLNTVNHLNMKLFIFVGILQVSKFEFLKFRILEYFYFHPWLNVLLKERTQCLTGVTVTGGTVLFPWANSLSSGSTRTHPDITEKLLTRMLSIDSKSTFLSDGIFHLVWYNKVGWKFMYCKGCHVWISKLSSL